MRTLSLRVSEVGASTRARLGDALTASVAASLPWSTSATGILLGAWVVCAVTSLTKGSLQRAISMPANAAAILLVLLGVLGMFWATVPWADRIDGVTSFLKLLCIPLLILQFSKSDQAPVVLKAFLISCSVLLITSWILYFSNFNIGSKSAGIPVKDYIAQGAMFSTCILILLAFTERSWRQDRRGFALGAALLALPFTFNIFFVAPSRTYLLIVPLGVVWFALRLAGWKGLVTAVFGLLLLVSAAWSTSSFFRSRAGSLLNEITTYQPSSAPTPAGERIEFWKKSVGFIGSAPILGHGTGAIREEFRRAAEGHSGMAGEWSANPHDQILAVGIQLGAIGILVLLLMWAAHLCLFFGNSLASWTGFIVVAQNVVSSLFNSHLFDFTHGWLYVLGVGVAGGVVLRNRI
jgi:O-antigen ligase